MWLVLRSWGRGPPVNTTLTELRLEEEEEEDEQEEEEGQVVRTTPTTASAPAIKNDCYGWASR